MSYKELGKFSMWPKSRDELASLGEMRVSAFCKLNEIEVPAIVYRVASEWMFSVCAYYRKEDGIVICLDKCQSPCGESQSRNWTWPANVIDREPYGVMAHELGHHCDVIEGIRCNLDVYRYSSKVSTYIRQESGDENPLTGYCENDAEWFAEMFRLFVTNPKLLEILRPRTFRSLSRRWNPMPSSSWQAELGENVPKRVMRSIENKIKTSESRKP